MASFLKICSMNVRGITDSIKRKDVFNWLKDKKYSIYCLQDIHVGDKNKTAFEKDWGSEVIMSSKSPESRGVAILFRGDLNFKVTEIEKDDMGNLLLIKLQVCDLNFYLCVIYGPNIDCPEFYVNLRNRLMQKENLPVVICGDWNLVMDYSADTYGYLKENNIRARKEVLNMIEGLNLIDTWRSENNNSKKFTWVSGKKPLKMARLDFFLVTPDIHAKINKYIKSFGYRSDHSLIGIEIDVNSTERGKGFWKFNSSLLQDVEYVTLVKNEIKNVIEDLTVGHGLQDTTVISRQMFWEILKLRIRGVTIP